MRLVALAFVLGTLFTSGAARATSMIPLDVSDLAQRADRIVYARVESTESKWTSSRDAIYTEVKLQIRRTYKGQNGPGETITVRREGGSVDGIGMLVHGAPAFSVGEEVVVFAEQRGRATWVVGMAQGKMRVETQSDGKKWVQPEGAGLHFLPQKAAQNVRLRPFFADGARKLDDLELEIQKHISVGGGGK